MSAAYQIPPGWQCLTWPTDWRPSGTSTPKMASTSQGLVPSQFCLAIHTPDMGSPGAAVIFTYEVRGDDVALAHISSVGEDVTAHLTQIVHALTAEQWQQHALAQVAAFCPKPDAEPAPTPGARNRYLLTSDHLQKVSAVYSDAVKRGEPPTRAVQHHFDTAHSTAAKWVGHARRAGLLPETTPGRTKRGAA